MLNFLSNALKFTNKGGLIKVSIKILDNQKAFNEQEGKKLKRKISKNLEKI